MDAVLRLQHFIMSRGNTYIGLSAQCFTACYKCYKWLCLYLHLAVLNLAAAAAIQQAQLPRPELCHALPYPRPAEGNMIMHATLPP